MLSVANPPGPPCYCKALDQDSDERAHPPERPSSPGADLEDDLDEAQQTNFSIRDYVFASRSKDVGTNWPFSEQCLQFCLKHGVRVLLPPFEPPDLVRDRFNRCVEIADNPIVCSAVEEAQIEADSAAIDCVDLSEKISDVVERDFSLPADESVLGSAEESGLGSSCQPPKPLLLDKSAVVQAVSSEDELICGEDESKVTDHEHARSIPSFTSEFPRSLQERRSLSESSSEVEVAKLPPLTERITSSCEPSVKKCRLIVKFGRTTPEPNVTEDTVASFSSVSDPMSSKVCPVCKTFSSTSNTTLNAHIDQCLSVESTVKRGAIKFSHHKVKPRKKRSMEEICATAPHCTLEDLDKRNGTNWALDLSSITKNNEALSTNESKRPRSLPLTATDVEREGAVYVDSNGTKLLILSKFNDTPHTPPAPPAECSGQKKFRKESGDKMTLPLRKKKCLSPKHRKYWKSKVQRKKMSAFNRLKGKVHKESKFHVDAHRETGQIPQASNAQEQIKVGRPGTLGQWICSKRSKLLKHLNSKFRHGKPRNQLAIEHDMSTRGDLSPSCEYYAIGGRPKEFCKYSDELLSSLKTRNADMLSNAVPDGISQEKHSVSLPDKNASSMGNNSSTFNGIKLKLSRSGGDCVSSVKSKRLNMRTNVVHKSGKIRNSTNTPVNSHPQVRKTRKFSRKSFLVDGSQCGMGTIKNNEVVQGFVSKNLRKCRVSEKLQKMVGSSPVESVERFHGSPSTDGPRSASNDVVSGIMHESNFAENFAMVETGDKIDHEPALQSNRMDSREADANYHASDIREDHTLDNSQLEAECRDTEVIHFDAQTEMLTNLEPGIKFSAEKSLGPRSSKIVTCEAHKETNCDRLDSCASLVHPGEPSDANEAAIEAGISKLSGDQGMYCGVIASDAISQDIWQVGQMVSDVKDGYCSEAQNLEYQSHIASIQSFTACLTGPGNKIVELGEGSSMILGGTVTAHVQNMAADGESSDSPVSATSTISHLSAEDVNSKGADRDPSEEPVVIQENLRPFSRNLSLPADESVGGTGRTDSEKTTQKAKALIFADELESFRDVLPCYCSRRESISCKPKTMRQSLMAGMMLPTKTKQMASSLCMRRVLSSHGAYSHCRPEAIPVLDSHTDSISPRPSPDMVLRFPPFNTYSSARSSSPIQSQTSSSPVLRLMGKNLMVMNREDKPVQQQNQAASCSSDNTSEAKYASLCSFHSTCNFSNIDDIQYHPYQYLEGSTLSEQCPANVQAPVPFYAERMNSVVGTTLLQTGLRLKTDSHGHQKGFDKKPSYSGVYNLDKVFPHERHRPIPASQASISEREVIVIDDSSEPEAEPSGSMQHQASAMAPTFSSLDVHQVRPPSNYASQNLFQSRELGCGVKPGFSISRPTNTNFTKWGSISESLDIRPPRVSAFPTLSVGQPAPMMYYPSFH